ncbi:alpha/beta hydrolase, partial [Cellulosimicrobium funkei]
RRTGTGVVYLAHGWGGRRGQLGAFVEPLRAAGHRVVAFDAPSHGDSGPGRLGPRRSTMPELADALAAVVREHGEATAVVAHSLGTATTVLAVREGLPAGRLENVAAIADGHGGRAHVASTPGAGPTLTRDLPRVPVPGAAPATADATTPYGATAPTAPTAPSAATPELPPDTPDAPPTSPGAGSETRTRTGTRTGTDDGADNGARSSTETGTETGTDPDGRTTR